MMSCSSEEDLLKQSIINERDNANGKDISIDLNKYSKEKILRICMQPPYCTKELMEERIGAKIDSFDFVDDKFFVLWVFTERPAPMKIKFHRWYELNFGEHSKECIATSHVKIIHPQLNHSQLYLD